MKRLRVVEVLWSDAYGVGERWEPRAGVESGERLIRTVGMEVARTKTHVVVASTHDPATDTVTAGISIPRAAIVERTVLRRAR